MNGLVGIIQWLVVIPAATGAIYSVASLVSAYVLFRQSPRNRSPRPDALPPVSVLKPIYGLERELERNLRSICDQDYPDYQVVLSVQRLRDPALPLLRRLAEEYGPKRVTLVVRESPPQANGKIQNLANALSEADHDLLVISDSDVRVQPDYLKQIVAPLEDRCVGYSCSLYRAVGAKSLYERLELLSLNMDFIPSVIFCHVTSAAAYCLGASVAFRRKDLEAIGGFESLADYLVEDHELGRRLARRGLAKVLVPHFVDVVVDFDGARQWWAHQVYWDQNTRAANPLGFMLSVLARSIPFALVFAALRFFDPLGLLVLSSALATRLGCAAIISGVYLRDPEGLGNIALLPLRDVLSLLSWYLAMTRCWCTWRGHRFRLTKDGRIARREASG